jgi:hypothetical protein
MDGLDPLLVWIPCPCHRQLHDPFTRGNVAGLTFDAKVLTVSESVSRGTRQDRVCECLVLNVPGVAHRGD